MKTISRRSTPQSFEDEYDDEDDNQRAYPCGITSQGQRAVHDVISSDIFRLG